MKAVKELDDAERIEEVHGLWELAVVRLATMTSFALYMHMPESFNKALVAAARDERDAFALWTKVSEEAALR